MRFLTTIVFLLPASRVKNQFLRLLGHSVGTGVRIAPNLVTDVRRFRLSEGASIGFGNVFRGVDVVGLGEHAAIGQWNWITATMMKDHSDRTSCVLTLGAHAAVVSRHYLDCSGGITIAEFAVMGGLRTVCLTHQADYRTAKLAVEGIRVGAYALVNSCNKLVPGANVPAKSVTTVGAVILPGLFTEGRLYGGVPAREIKAIDGSLFQRQRGRFEF